MMHRSLIALALMSAMSQIAPIESTRQVGSIDCRRKNKLTKSQKKANKKGRRK